MKPTDYHSSSSDEEDDEATAQHRNDDSRLSDDDDEHNFDDDDDDEQTEDEASSADEEDVQFDDEDDAEAYADETKLTGNKKPASKDDDVEDGEDGDEADGEDDDDDDDSGEEDEEEGNADWAKSLAKILKQEKPKNKKAVTLSKAKKTSEILEAREKAKAIGFDIDGEIKEEKPDAQQLEDALAEAERKRKKKAAFNLRIKPAMTDRERERAFKKIATKGVVQLFNAVRTQQKDLSQQLEQAGRLDHRRDAVLNNINKRKFLDVLMGGKRAKSENVDNPIKDELKEEDDGMESMDDEVYNDGLPKNSIWSVLKEDFLSNKKMSHWDKDEEEDEPANTDGDDDDESD